MSYSIRSVIFLDSNIVILFNKRAFPSLEQRITAARDADLALGLPSIVLLELEVGVLLKRFLSLISEIPAFDPADALVAAEIRAGLMQRGEMIGAYDLLIAAQVLRRNAILITRNASEFARVPGLIWEDWTQS